MNISRRWFLKSAVMAAVATQIPLPDFEGHRVLFIDGSALMVDNYTIVDGIIRAKVVNGAWDLVLNTKSKMMESWSNPAYGYDADCIAAELKDSRTYRKLLEIEVSKSIGEVTEDLKPRTVMVGKWKEVEETKLVMEQDKETGKWRKKRGSDGKPVFEKVTKLEPVLKEVSRTWDNSDKQYWVEESFNGPGYWQQGGILTITSWVQDEEPIIVDPLNGAGVDYNAVIAAAEQRV